MAAHDHIVQDHIVQDHVEQDHVEQGGAYLTWRCFAGVGATLTSQHPRDATASPTKASRPSCSRCSRRSRRWRPV